MNYKYIVYHTGGAFERPSPIRRICKNDLDFSEGTDENSMKVKANYILRNIADEYLLIPTGKAALTTRGLIAVSESGCLLYQKLQDDRTREELIAALTAEYDVTEAVAGADVDAFLGQMRQLDMLLENEE